MMSINGMISIRARLCGTGECTLILWNLVRRPSHGKGDGNVDLGNCPGSKSPLPKGAGGGIILYWASGVLRVGCDGDIVVGRVNYIDDHSTNVDDTRTCIVWVM